MSLEAGHDRPRQILKKLTPVKNYAAAQLMQFATVFAVPRDCEREVARAIKINWVLTAAIIAFVLMWTGFSDFHLNRAKTAILIGMLTVVGIGCYLVRTRLRLQTLPALIEAMAQFPGVSLFIVLMTYQFGSVGAPWADRWLAAPDQFVGFDWVATNWYVAHHEWLARLLRLCYGAIVWQPPFVIILLAFRMSHRRLAQFMLAWTLSLTMTSVVFVFAPAKSAYIYYGTNHALLPELSKAVGQGQFEVLETLRSGGLRFLLDQDIAGLVTFPSFHCTAAVLFAWALWSTRCLRWPGVIVNVLMITATPIIGAHYLVDLVAGLAVAIIAIRLAGRWMDAPSQGTWHDCLSRITTAVKSKLGMAKRL